jgi:hypothetical protein
MLFSIKTNPPQANLWMIQANLEKLGHRIDAQDGVIVINPISFELMLKTWGTAIFLQSVSISLDNSEAKLDVKFRFSSLMGVLSLFTIAGLILLTSGNLLPEESKKILPAMFICVQMLIAIVFTTLVSTIKQDIQQ